MIDYLLEDKIVLETGKYREYERKLLSKLVDMLKEDDDVSTILIKKIDSKSVTKLIELVEQGKFDLEVHNLLTELNISNTSPKFVQIIGDMIRNSAKKSVAETYVLMSNLIRYLLLLYSYKYLEKIPEKCFSRKFFSSFADTLPKNVFKSTEVLTEIKYFWTEYMNVAINGSKEFQDSIDSFLHSLFHSNNYWLSARINMLRSLKQNLRSKINYANAIDIQEYLSDATGGVEVISECVRVIIINILREFLNESYPGGSNMNDLYRKGYFKNFSTSLVNQIYTDEWDRSRFTFGHYLLDSGISTFLETVSNNMVQRLKYFIENNRDNFHVLFRQIADGNWTLNDKNAAALDSFDFSLSFFQFLEAMATDLVKKVCNELNMMKDEEVLNTSEFLTIQLNSLLKTVSKEGFLNLPLRLSSEKLDILLKDLIEELSNPERKWEVFFEIGNVDLKGEMIILGNATLFDARKWHKDETFEWDKVNEGDANFKSVYREYDFGLFRRFGSSERTKILFKRNSARARISVTATDHEVAVLKAKNSLKKIFSTMVFEFSEKNRRNYRPQFSNRFQVMSIDGKAGTYSVNFDTSSILDVSTKEKSSLDWYIQSTSVSHRASRLNRALSWFNAAFWEHEFHSKYALYWIGLEQLLDLDAEGNNEGSRKALLRLVPKISVSWRDYRHERFVIGQYMKELAAKLSKKPGLIELIDKHDALKDWSKRDYVVLENLSLLDELADDPDISLTIKNLQKWMDDEKSDIIEFIKDRRGFVEFQAAYLYARRNSIMHEGITDFSNMEFFVNELENLLKKIISISLTFPSETTWDKISEQFNRPFSANTN